MANAPFKTDPVRTAIALAYTNAAFVADRVLPRVSVTAREYKWTRYNKEDRFTIPNTTVGRKGRVNEVEFGGTEDSSMVRDFGLEDPIPQDDIDAAANTDMDPLGDSTEFLTDLILLDREKRVASVAHDKTNYANVQTISGTDQWTDKANSSPITQLSDALESPLVRPNVMVINGTAALALRRHPELIKAYNGTSGDTGMVPLDFIRQLFDLDDIVVGRARYNSANKGQTMTLSYLWGPHCALIYRNPNAKPQRGITFGWTAQFKGRVAGTRQDPDIGLQGGTRVRVGEMVDEKIVANDVAYFLENVVPAA